MKNKLFFILIVLFHCLNGLNAADMEHGSMGGYISYKYLGNNKIQFFIHFYSGQHFNAYNSIDTTTHSQTIDCKVRCNLKIGSYSETVPLKFESKTNPAYPCHNPYTSNIFDLIHLNLRYIFKFSAIVDLNNSTLDSLLKKDSFLVINTEYQWPIHCIGYCTLNANFPYTRFSAAINTRALHNGMSGLDFKNGHNFILSCSDSTTSFHHGAYPNFGDSVYFELLDLETDSKNNKPSYKLGLSGKYPIPTLCPGGTNYICSPNLNRKPLPTGFYFNNATGEMTLVPKVPSSLLPGMTNPVYLRGHIYHKNASNQWIYQGYNSILMLPYMEDSFQYVMENQIGVLPVMNIPRKVEICESDTATIEISTRAINPNFKDTAFVSIEGNITIKNYSLRVDYSKPYLPKILLKVWTNPNDPNNGPALLSVRLSKKLKFGNCNTIGGPVRTQTVEVVFRKKFQPEISTIPGPCNGITAKTLDKVPGVITSSTWKVYKDSISKNPLAVYSSSNFTLKGVDKAKYYFVCTVKANKAVCSEKTLRDSVNMIVNWPNIDFSLNQTTRCSQDSSQAFYPINMVGFASNKSFWWETDSTIYKADTMFYSSFTSNRILLRITDTAGCDLSKEFHLEKDSLSSLSLQSHLLCTPEKKRITFNSSYKNYFPIVSWKCISSYGDTAQYVNDTAISIFFKAPQNRIIAQFISSQGCTAKLETTVQVDTTQFYVGKIPQLCKHDSYFNLNNIPIAPKGGFWNSQINSGDSLHLTSFSSYPTTLACYYFYGSKLSACEYIDTQYLVIEDTIKEIVVTPALVCSENREISLDSLFKPPFYPGSWSSTASTSNLSFSAVLRSISPRNSTATTHKLFYHYSKDVCSNQTQYSVEIAPRTIDLMANIDPYIAKIDQPINFTANNIIATSITKYRWIFGDSLGGIANESIDQNPVYSYKKVGLFYPILFASTATCTDSMHLPAIRIELLSTLGQQISNSFQILPNPFQDDIWITSLSEDIFIFDIVVRNTHGKTVYSKDKITLPISSPASDWSAGIYLVSIANRSIVTSNTETIRILKTP